jgi:hypothetical protein
MFYFLQQLFDLFWISRFDKVAVKSGFDASPSNFVETVGRDGDEQYPVLKHLP